MADPKGPETEDSAEKAYAAAAEAASVPAPAQVLDEVSEPQEAPATAAVDFPPKAKRGRKGYPVPLPDLSEIDDVVSPIVPDAPIARTEPAPVKEAPVAKAAPKAVKPKAIKPRKAVAKPVSTKPVPVKATPIKPAAKAIPAKVIPAKPTPAKPAARIAPAPKAAKVQIEADKTPTISQLKEKIMATKTTDFTDGFKNVISDAQAKAKSAFDKGTAAFGDYTEFAKGNVEAAVESGKILAAGLKSIGDSYVTEGKSAFETMTSDVKELTAAKSPADLFKLQSDLARRNFDSAVAFGSKNSEAFLKLANDVMAPLSNRVSLAVEKVKKAA